MPSIYEILQQTGFSPSEIRELDPRAVDAFSNVLNQAEQIGKSNTAFYENQIMPALLEWPNERDQIEAARVKAQCEADYYRSAAVSAGILPGEATPGTPQFTNGGDMSQFAQRAGQAIGALADVSWRYESLYGSKLPISPSELVRLADSQGVDPLTYADRKFGFAKREQEINTQRQREAEQKIRDDERSKVLSQYSDGATGLNVPSGRNVEMASIRREVKAGTRPDPLKMDQAGRRQAALQAIHRHIEERAEREG